MEYKKLIHRLITTERLERKHNSDYNGIYSEAANAITDLLVENQSLRNAANGFKARAEVAETRAEKAERERDEAREVICARCRVFSCRGNECYWYRGQKEE